MLKSYGGAMPEKAIPLAEAVERVSARRNVSKGFAAMELGRLCAGRGVRSYSVVRHSAETEFYLLSPRHWQEERLINFESNSLGETAEASSIYNVYVNEADLVFALGETPGGKKPRPNRPNDAELDAWMVENVQRGCKRELTIKGCCDALEATWRQAESAWKRRREAMGLKQGQKT
jgi:hypothetical protein